MRCFMWPVVFSPSDFLIVALGISNVSSYRSRLVLSRSLHCWRAKFWSELKVKFYDVLVIIIVYYVLVVVVKKSSKILTYGSRTESWL